MSAARQLFGVVIAVLAAGDARAAPTPAVPLTVGLTIVTAVEQAGVGDYESVLRVEAVSEREIVVRLTWDAPIVHAKTGRTRVVQLQTRRTILRRDWLAGRGYEPWFRGEEGVVGEERFEGYTAIGPSRAVVEELMQSGEARFALGVGTLAPEVDEAQIAALRAYDAEAADRLEQALRDAVRVQRERMPLLRRGPKAEPIVVLVDGVPRALDVITAAVTVEGRESRLWILADPALPIVLRSEHAGPIGDRREARGQVIRIDVPGGWTGAGSTPTLETALRETGRATLDGIYFDFGSDRLRAESGAVLDRAAAAIRATGAPLVLEGHTDDVGDDAHNLELSRRRANAVREALVQRGIPAERLRAVGFGESRPVATNTTLAGRAQNRRVELVDPARHADARVDGE